MRLNLRRKPETHHEHSDSLASSEYVQINNQQEEEQEEEGDPFQNISTPNTPPINNNKNQLDLSCVNSDETDASITSLFSFPDPLSSISENTHSDHLYHPTHWLNQYTGELSEHHSDLQLDSSDSHSPPLTDPDLPSSPRTSSSSSSSPTPALFQSPAGSDLSHRLQIYFCGHDQPTHSQSLEILSNLRINFSQHDNILSHHHHLTPPSQLTRHRFRRAVSKVLSSSHHRTTTTTIGHPDLFYQTSWLEILSSDLTTLSELDQASFLASSLPEQPALIIHITRSPEDSFPITPWLSQLSRTCSAQLGLFKVLPVLIDEKKSNFQSLLEAFQAICGFKSTHPLAHIVTSSTTTDQPPLTHEERVDHHSCLLLQQDTTPDSSVDHLLRPRDLAMMSAPSVAKLHQLLVPYESSTKPDQRKKASQEVSAGSKMLTVLACLVAMIAAATMVFYPQALLRQPELPNLGAMESLPYPTERANVTSAIALEHGPLLITKASDVTVITPTPVPCENDTTTNVPIMLPREKPELANDQPQMADQVIDQGEGMNEQQVDGHGATLVKPRDDSQQQQAPTAKPAPKRLVGWRLERVRGGPMLKRASAEYQAKLISSKKKLIRLASSHEMSTAHVKLWTRRLPPRLRKGLHNLRTEPGLCISHLARKSLPKRFLPSTTSF